LNNDQLVFTRRWAPWWLAPIVLIGYALYGRVLINSVMIQELGVRMIIPPYLLFGWLVLAVAANIRENVVTPNGVRASNMPFPCWPAPRMRRDDVWNVYARRLVQLISTEGPDVFETTYWAGVENARGRRIDVAGPFATLERARQEAHRIAGMLNRNPKGRRLDVGTSADSTPADVRRWRFTVLTWMAAFFVALAAGIYWEVH
jgi:hypothetical protein